MATNKTELKNELTFFIHDNTKNELVFPCSLSKEERAYLHRLAQGFDLTTFSQGVEDERFLTVQKNDKFREKKGRGLLSKNKDQTKKEGQQRKRHDVQNMPKLNPSETFLNSIQKIGLPTKEELRRLLPVNTAQFVETGLYPSDGFSRLSKGNPRVPPKGINLDLITFRSTLPVFEKQRDIGIAVNTNPVTIICGETGCGKTTQVPQLILASAHVNDVPARVVVLLPRRVAAVSVSERVALERGEQLGDIVGYQVKYESRVSERTLLTFCTNGVFMRSLLNSQHDKLFHSFTHIILDEIHERDKTADFALIMIKNALLKYPHLKLILMSATMDIDVFTRYFTAAGLDSQIFQVTGRLFSVEHVYLDGILSSDGCGYRTSRMTSKMQELGFSEPDGPPQQISPGEQDIMDVIISKCFDDGSDKCFTDTDSYLSERDYPSYLIDAKHSETGQTVLMASFRHANYDFAYSMLKAKTLWELSDNNGKTALDYAKETNDQDMLDLSESFILLNSRKEQEQNGPEKDITNLVLAYESAYMFVEVDYNLILEVLLYIHSTCREGAVLVFVPGYDNISSLLKTITDRKDEFEGSGGSFEVFTLHSKILLGQQSRVFKPLPQGVRKIILSTNIAETSVTIEDVNYVIDTGKVKEMVYDSKTCVSELRVDWVSQACAKQRAGRAGRVSNGLCFRLYSKEKYETMKPYQTPEILREPLEEICLQARKLTPEGTTIEDFLMDAVEPPKAFDILHAIEQLQKQDALDAFENLTELGHYLLRMPLEPCYGKMLLYACMLKCLEPVLIIISCLATMDPFKLPTEQQMRAQASFKKLELSMNMFSDHFIYLRLFQEWLKSKEKGNTRNWCNDMFVSISDMYTIERTRDQLVANLRSWGFGNPDDLNKNSHCWAVVKAAITAGLSHNIFYVGDLIGKKSEQRYGTKVSISNSSVLMESVDPGGRRRKITPYDLPSEWMVFERKQKMHNGCITIKNCTAISPLTVALFGGPIRNSMKEQFEEDEMNIEGAINKKQKDNCVANEVEGDSNCDKARESKGQGNDASSKDYMSIINIDHDIDFCTPYTSAKAVMGCKAKFNNMLLDKLQNKETKNDDMLLDCIVKGLKEEEDNEMPKLPCNILLTKANYRSARATQGSSGKNACNTWGQKPLQGQDTRGLRNWRNDASIEPNPSIQNGSSFHYDRNQFQDNNRGRQGPLRGHSSKNDWRVSNQERGSNGGYEQRNPRHANGQQQLHKQYENSKRQYDLPKHGANSYKSGVYFGDQQRYNGSYSGSSSSYSRNNQRHMDHSLHSDRAQQDYQRGYSNYKGNNPDYQRYCEQRQRQDYRDSGYGAAHKPLYQRGNQLMHSHPGNMGAKCLSEQSSHGYPGQSQQTMGKRAITKQNTNKNNHALVQSSSKSMNKQEKLLMGLASSSQDHDSGGSSKQLPSYQPMASNQMNQETITKDDHDSGGSSKQLSSYQEDTTSQKDVQEMGSIQMNQEEILIKEYGVKYFIIRKGSPKLYEETVRYGHGVWGVTLQTGRILNAAYKRYRAVILIFALDGAQYFHGYGKMIGEGYTSTVDFANQDIVMTVPAELHYVKPNAVPFSGLGLVHPPTQADGEELEESHANAYIYFLRKS